MPFAPRRRRSADDFPPEQQWTDRVPTHRMPRPAADDARVPPYGDPWAAPPPSDPWTPPPPRSQPWPPAPPSEPWAPPPPERRRPDTRRRRGGVPPQDEPQGRKRRRLRRRIGRFLVVAFLVQALVLLSLRWIDPPTTAFMLANTEGAIQQSVPVEHVSRNFLAAVIAHEDQLLPYRDGAFNWNELFGRAEAHLRGEEDPSGSTIPQQVAKNLFLNQEMSAWRKAVEAGLSMELALVLDDRRMLELYVNYAQFGPTDLRRLLGQLVLLRHPAVHADRRPGRAAGRAAALPRPRPARARRRAGLPGGRRPRLAVPLARHQRAEPGAAAH